MFGKICLKLNSMFAYAGSQSLSMRRKLMLYLLGLILLAFIVIVLIIFASGLLSYEERYIKKSMELQQQISSNLILNQMDHFAAKGIHLSGELSNEMQNLLREKSLTFTDLNDNPEMILELQSRCFGALNTALQSSGSTGAYLVADVTTNTALRTEKESRASLYIRHVNIQSPLQSNRYLSYFRGVPDLARQKKIEMHNRWELEHKTEDLPSYTSLMGQKLDRVADAYYFTKKMRLPGTWEDLLLLCVPLTDGEKLVRGLCGLEYSELYFKVSHPSVRSEFGNMFTVLVPLREEKLYLSEGLIGGTENIYIHEQDVLQIAYGKYLNTYLSETGEGDFVGLQSLTPVSSDEQWFICTLLPYESYRAYVWRSKLRWLISAAVFLLLMIILASVMSRRFVNPIVRSLYDIREKERADKDKTGIAELDELLGYLKEKEKHSRLSVPPSIAELLEKFLLRVERLDKVEKLIFGYYAEGRALSELPGLLYISGTTLKKYNNSIYTKLEIGSHDELMLYIDLFRRCGKLEQLRE